MTTLANGWLHLAQAGPLTQPNGVTYYLGGRIAYRLTGFLQAEPNPESHTVALTGGRMIAAPQSAGAPVLGIYDPDKVLSIKVLGGYLSVQGDRGAGGFLYTRFSQAGAPDRGVAFYFSPLPFGRVRNAFADPALEDFRLWGNNTEVADGAPVPDPELRLGIELRAASRRFRVAG